MGKKKTTAVILAAGLGSRLGNYTKNLPKCLIEIDEQPLIYHSLKALKDNHFSEIIIVIGYFGDLIEQKVGNSFYGMKIKYIKNAHYNKTGSVYSLFLAASLVKTDIVVLESDLLYAPYFLSSTIKSKNENEVLAADISGSGDEVFLCQNNEGKLTFLGKKASHRNKIEAIGEFAGIVKLSYDFFKVYCAYVEKISKKNAATGHYEDLIFRVSQTEKFSVWVNYCKGKPWTEIDNAQDLDRAKNKVYPKLKRAFFENAV